MAFFSLRQEHLEGVNEELQKPCSCNEINKQITDFVYSKRAKKARLGSVDPSVLAKLKIEIDLICAAAEAQVNRKCDCPAVEAQVIADVECPCADMEDKKALSKYTKVVGFVDKTVIIERIPSEELNVNVQEESAQGRMSDVIEVVAAVSPRSAIIETTHSVTDKIKQIVTYVRDTLSSDLVASFSDSDDSHMPIPNRVAIVQLFKQLSADIEKHLEEKHAKESTSASSSSSTESAKVVAFGQEKIAESRFEEVLAPRMFLRRSQDNVVTYQKGKIELRDVSPHGSSVCDMVCQQDAANMEEENKVEEEEHEMTFEYLNPTELAVSLLDDILRYEVFCYGHHLSSMFTDSMKAQSYAKETIKCLGRYCCGKDLYSEEYIWIFYLLVQLCEHGALSTDIFSNGELASNSETAKLIIELVDNVLVNSTYLRWNKDVVERIAQQIIWQILSGRNIKKTTTEGLVSVGAVNVGNNYRDISIALSEFRYKFPLDRKDRSVDVVEKTSSELQMEYEKKKCEAFSGVESVANHFVNDILGDSTKIIKELDLTEYSPNLFPLHKKYTHPHADGIYIGESYPTETESRVSFPRIKDFTIKKGAVAIINYILQWHFHEDWHRVIRFKMAQSDECSDYYLYDVIFSLPTQLYPVAQATATVLFNIDVSRVKPDVCRVDVTYQFESKRLVHRLYQYPFKEEWLFEIIRSKLRLLKQIKF